MSSVLLSAATHGLLRTWATRTGRPTGDLVHDALEQVVADPATAVLATELTPAPRGGWPLPVRTADRPLWGEARDALATVTACRSLGSVVRGLVLLRLAEDLGDTEL